MVWLSGLMWCAGVVGALGVTLGALLFVYQDRLLYIPSVPIRDPDDNPRGASLSTCSLVPAMISAIEREREEETKESEREF